VQRYVGRLMGGLLLAGATVVASPAAYAFLPAGGFDSFDTLRFRRFPLKEFDNNNDGRVDPGEGLEMLIEGGPRGFTPEEIERVLQGLQVWEDVPTSYVSFGNVSVTQDPIDIGSALPDFQNSITLQVTEDEVVDEGQEPDSVADLTDGLVGITLSTWTLDDTIVPGRGEAFIVPAGTIIDADIIVNASLHRVTDANQTVVELEATMVILTGSFLGLSFTPLNNLREIDIIPGDDGAPDGLLESEVLALTGADGEQRRIGATPSMFPAYFLVDDFETGTFRGGWSDLAPDDISGISWLYPRGSQAQFFSIQQEARTNVRNNSNLPTIPVSGGHIVAWADADNDPTTGRVPLFNTLTGLYIHPLDVALWGRFELIGLWKQMEIPGTDGIMFNPTYTLSINPLNGTGLSRQAPGDFLIGNTAEFFDSISGEASLSVVVGGSSSGTKDYDVNFQSEVFQEDRNVTDVSNKDAGTPLVWDYTRNTVVSADTGRSIPEMLPTGPMFGEANEVCWLNVISGTEGGAQGGGFTGTDTGGLSGLGGSGGLFKEGGAAGSVFFKSTSRSSLLRSGPRALRWFRDDVLLKSAPGTALVQAYYQTAPTFARFLLKYTDAIAPVKRAVLVFYWLLLNPAVPLAGLGALFGLVWLYRRHRRAAVSVMAALGFLIGANTADAQIVYLTNKQMMQKSDLVVRGTIETKESYWSGGGRIYTDHTFKVTEVIKAPTAPAEDASEKEKQTAAPAVSVGNIIPFSVIGGTVGDIHMKASSIPKFDVGDSIVLFFIWKQQKWVILSGERGKVDIVTRADGKEYVVGTSPTAGIGLLEASKDVGSANKPGEEEFRSAEIPVDDFVAYLRGLVTE
jgi:hypothetical protein